MDVKQIVGGVFLAIIIYLLLNNGQNTSTVISSLSTAFNGAVSNLQGRQTA